MFNIIKPGLKTTIQDNGRYGFYHLGVPPSGAADKFSYRIGNILLGNPLDSAALEMTLLGPVIEVEKSTVISVTGAPARVLLNQKEIPMWETVKVVEGDLLEFSYHSSKAGVYTYLCVSGGFSLPEVLGSRSAYLLSDFEGYLGRRLAAGDEVAVSEPLPGAFKRAGISLPDMHIPAFSNHVNVRAVMGLTSDLITDEGVTGCLNSEWTTQMESDRVALRMKGAIVPSEEFPPPFGSGGGFASVVDMAYPIGAILVPNEEEIIVLLNDATSGGGFISLGTVISMDLDLIAQARPLTTIRFHAVTIDQALVARRERKKKLALISEMLG
ncbi:biotin-dependent carboxyltransferase family protein [Fictibacillus fluitans]|uniref:Biotin-dependent carboxyltransferase family protein n=1 Tax=Fictibacillus fluitans TaxID=3058422 RepID=A0ABT8HT03_9BACL|nr:biotin-dependent carboxyltransferase family protein [Fictibacillus sp. NE201]MDN4523904.1 biotin-dependent carboxyltransferase family protein [Fictibacillus sp. NE201]